MDSHLIKTIKKCLPYIERLPKYKKSKNPLAGHCYIASEAYYHMMGGKANGLKPVHLKVGTASHWFLIDSNNEIIDITAKQFKHKPNYKLGKGKGFLTKHPSKRARILISLVYGIY